MHNAQQTAEGIAAVFVTMNRCEVARTCLARLASQTLRPEKVFVVDNASTDATRSMLDEASHVFDGWLVRIDLEENIGNAGGMEIALEALFKDGFEAVWILDDDSWPEPEALAHLMAAAVPAHTVRSCKVIDMATGELSWPVQLPHHNGWKTFKENDLLPAELAIRIRRSWLGALIPREVYKMIGPVEGRLFLRGEDEDYPRRIERAGFPVYMISQSLLYHPRSGSLNHWEMFGISITLESGLAGDKLYYRLRNMWWLTRRDKGTAAAATLLILHGVALSRWAGPLSAWFPVWFEAARDAFGNRLGKRRQSQIGR